MLGGVRVDGSQGLGGHSDADALLHAVVDALLGAGALGDIGGHFPPGDPAYKGIDSRELLRRAVALLTERGYNVLNVDATIIAERPRLAPHLEEMERTIAADLGVDDSQVNVKATTHEGLGAIGRGEGIAAMAVALIE
ncbi:MAG: 2-C-methyl-D-erythritol 2,4-cyclodiphosphate synthase [Dehalococcoidia bacterium]